MMSCVQYCFCIASALHTLLMLTALLFLQRLATTDWFTSRVSSCGVFATAYPRAPKNLQADLRQLYGKLCRDDTPMVRRAAAFRLGKFADTVEPELVSKEIVPLFQDLTQDGKSFMLPIGAKQLCTVIAYHCRRSSVLTADQDSVRLLAVETCGPLARLLNKGESVQHVLPIVQKFAQVRSALPQLHLCLCIVHRTQMSDRPGMVPDSRKALAVT